MLDISLQSKCVFPCGPGTAKCELEVVSLISKKDTCIFLCKTLIKFFSLSETLIKNLKPNQSSNTCDCYTRVPCVQNVCLNKNTNTAEKVISRNLKGTFNNVPVPDSKTKQKKCPCCVFNLFASRYFSQYMDSRLSCHHNSWLDAPVPSKTK